MRATRWSIVILALAFSLQPGCSCNGGNNNDFDAMTGGPDAGGTADADLSDGGGGDGGSAVMSITEIIPTAASRRVDTELTVLGANIAPGATLVLENCDTSTQYESLPPRSRWRPTAPRSRRHARRRPEPRAGPVFGDRHQPRHPEPIVWNAPSTPGSNTADRHRRGPGDRLPRRLRRRHQQRRDGHHPGPVPASNRRRAVRWVKDDNSASYSALFVGYVSEHRGIAIVPSETLGMSPGDYHVFVANPESARAPSGWSRRRRGHHPGRLHRDRDRAADIVARQQTTTQHRCESGQAAPPRP